MTELSRHKNKPNLKPCSELSQLLEEDPIGTAPIWDKCIVIELAAPWSAKIENSKNFEESIRNKISELNLAGQKVRLQCILPDPLYSQPGMRRVILFKRNPRFLASADRAEYLVPKKRLSEICLSILENSIDLGKYKKFKQMNNSVRDILVCTHGNRDRCCGSIAIPLYNKLKGYYTDSLKIKGGIRIWRTSHTGGHRFAPTIIDLPQARYWAYANKMMVDSIITKSEPITNLKKNYRGCALLASIPEQNSERELMIKLGWNWIDAQKEISTLKSSPGDSHLIQTKYIDSLTNLPQVFNIKIEYTKSIPTMNCMKEGNKGFNKKYRVVEGFEL